MNFIDISRVCLCCLNNVNPLDNVDPMDEIETFFAYCDKHQNHMSYEHDRLYNGDVNYYIIGVKNGIKHYMLIGVDYDGYNDEIKAKDCLKISLSKFGYNDILISKSKQKLLKADKYRAIVEMSRSIKHIETSLSELSELKNVINDFFNIYRVSTS